MSLLPDYVYASCTAQSGCDICSNTEYSSVLDGPVHDTLRGKVFCPFGKVGTMNGSIYADQTWLNNAQDLPLTTWGRAPQLNPRPLTKIGLSWISS